MYDTWRLPTLHLGRTVRVYDALPSTNTLALELAGDRANAGVAWLARTQSAGRGQHGRSWTAPPESSVLLSVLLYPPAELRRPALVTGWAAVSVCETILKLANLQAKIKWPNDVLILGKKVCGILIEQRTVESSLATVVGIGLNVSQSADMFAEANLPDACSLAMMGSPMLEYETVAKALLSELDQQYDALIRGDVHTLEAQWKWRFGLLGKQVRVETVHGDLVGRVLDMTFAGIELEIAPGQVQRILPEVVKHIAATATESSTNR